MSNGLSQLLNNWIRLIKEQYTDNAFLIERFNFYDLTTPDIVKLLMSSLGIPYDEELTFEQNVQFLTMTTPWFKTRGTARSIQSLIRADHQNDTIDVYEPFKDVIRPCRSDVSGSHHFTDSDYYRPGVYDVQNLATINEWVIQAVRDHIPAGQKAYRTFEAIVIYNLDKELELLTHYDKLMYRFAEAVGLQAGFLPLTLELMTYSYCPPSIEDETDCCPFITSGSDISGYCTLIPLAEQLIEVAESSNILSQVTKFYNKYIIDPIEGDSDIVDDPPPIEEEPHENVEISDIDPTRVSIYGYLASSNFYDVFINSDSDLSGSDILSGSTIDFKGILDRLSFLYNVQEEIVFLPDLKWDYVFWGDLDDYFIGDPPEIGEYAYSKVTLYGDISYHEYPYYPGNPIVDFGNLNDDTIEVSVLAPLTDSGIGTDTIKITKS